MNKKNPGAESNISKYPIVEMIKVPERSEFNKQEENPLVISLVFVRSLITFCSFPTLSIKSSLLFNTRTHKD